MIPNIQHCHMTYDFIDVKPFGMRVDHRGLIYTQLRFFDLTPTGRALNRCLKDMSTMDDRMPAAFRELFESFMNVCISLLILSLYAWQALLVVPPFGVVYWMTMTIYRWPARDLRRLEGTSRSPGMSHFSDSVKGARTIRAFGHEARLRFIVIIHMLF